MRSRRVWGLVAILLLLLVHCAPADGTTPQPAEGEPPEMTKESTETPAPAATETSTSTPTAPPSETASTPSATPTESPAPTSEPASPTTPPTAPASPTSTPSPARPPGPDCSVLPEGAFLPIWQGDPALQSDLGCPTSGHPRVEPAAWEVQTSYQPFEGGAMVWSNHFGWYQQPVIFVLYADGTYQQFQDTYDPAVDPLIGGATPPAGLREPKMGFGKVWREEPGVQSALGWATAVESTGPGRFQFFTHGYMLWLSQRGETYVLRSGAGTYTVVSTPSF